MFCKRNSHPSRSNSAFSFCTFLSSRREVAVGWKGANQSSKSIYKCTDAGRRARGHSLGVLFGVYVVSTSISHLSTRRRQRRNDMFPVTFSYRRAQASECDLGDLAAFCLYVGFSHSFFPNTPAVHTWKIPDTSQTHFFSWNSVASLASVAPCNFQLVLAKRYSLETRWPLWCHWGHRRLF